MFRTFFTFDEIYPKTFERIDIELKELHSELYAFYSNMYITVRFPTDFTASLFRAVREVVSSYIKIEIFDDSIDFNKSEMNLLMHHITLSTPEELKPRILTLYIELLKHLSISITISIKRKGRDNEIIIGFPNNINSNEIMNFVKSFFDNIYILSIEDNCMEDDYYVVTYRDENHAEILVGLAYGNISDHDALLKQLFNSSTRQTIAELIASNPTEFYFYKLNEKPEKTVIANLQLDVKTKEL